MHTCNRYVNYWNYFEFLKYWRILRYTFFFVFNIPDNEPAEELCNVSFDMVVIRVEEISPLPGSLGPMGRPGWLKCAMPCHLRSIARKFLVYIYNLFENRLIFILFIMIWLIYIHRFLSSRRNSPSRWIRGRVSCVQFLFAIGCMSLSSPRAIYSVCKRDRRGLGCP